MMTVELLYDCSSRCLSILSFPPPPDDSNALMLPWDTTTEGNNLKDYEKLIQSAQLDKDKPDKE